MDGSASSDGRSVPFLHKSSCSDKNSLYTDVTHTSKSAIHMSTRCIYSFRHGRTKRHTHLLEPNTNTYFLGLTSGLNCAKKRGYGAEAMLPTHKYSGRNNHVEN